MHCPNCRRADTCHSMPQLPGHAGNRFVCTGCGYQFSLAAPLSLPPADTSPSRPAAHSWDDLEDANEPDRPRRRESSSKSGKRPIVLAVASVAAILVLTAVAVVIWVAVWGRVNGKQGEPVATADSSTEHEKPKREQTTTSRPVSPPVVPPAAPPTAKLSPDEVYEQAIRGCVLIETTNGPGVTGVGTGWLVDRERKLVMTAYHVVDDADSIKVHFPQFDKAGRPVADAKAYLDGKAKDSLRAKVLKPSVGRKRDVVVLQLDGPLPAGVRQVPLAPDTNPAKPGQPVQSVGSSGASDGVLWRSIPGAISTEAVERSMPFRGGSESAPRTVTVEARIREIKAENNPGDSGGPVLNDRGQVMGLVSAGSVKERGIMYAIDVTELRSVLAEVRGEPTPTTPVTPIVPAVVVNEVKEWVEQLRTGRTTAMRLDAAKELGELKTQARSAVPAMLDILNAEKDAQVVTAIAAALDQIGEPAKADLGSLLAALKSGGLPAKTYAAGIYAITPAPREVAVELAAVARDPGERNTATTELRRRAVVALGKLGIDGVREAGALGTLFDCADSPAVKVADAAVEVLTAFNTTSKPAFDKRDTDLLRQAAAGPNVRLQRLATAAFRDIAATAEETFAFYRKELLDSPDAQVRANTIAALTRWPIAKWPDAYRTAVLALDADPSGEVRVAVLKVAEEATDKATLLRLGKIARTDEDPAVGLAAVAALVKANPPEKMLSSTELAGLLAAALDTPRMKRLAERRAALIKTPEDADEHRKAVAEFATAFAQDVKEKKLLLDRLAALGPAAEATVPAIVKVLGEHVAVGVRLAAVTALEKCGPAAAADAKKRAATVLAGVVSGKGKPTPTREEFTADPDQKAETEATLATAGIAALVEFGADGVVPLSSLLTEDGLADDGRTAMCKVLAKLGTKAQAAGPQLVALGESNSKFRDEAGTALAAIGGDAAVEHLRKHTDFSKERLLPLNKRDPVKADLRRWVYETLGEIDPAGLSDAGRRDCQRRLETAVLSEIDPTCLKVAERALKHYDNRLDALKKK